MIHADTAEDEHPYPLVQTLEKVHPLGCHHICTSLDGKVTASIGFGGELRIWQCDESGVWSKRGDVTGKCHPIHPASTPRLTINNVLTDEKTSKTEHWALALSENGQYLAASTHDGKIDIYDTTTVAQTPTPKLTTYETKGSFALAVDISPNGDLTASGHQNGTLHLFNNSTRRLAHALAGLIKPIRAVRFSPANKYLAAAGDARIVALYDTQSGEQVANLTGHGGWVMSVDWNWSGEFLLSGAYDGKAKVWSLERRECVATQTESDKCLWCVRWLPKAAALRNETFVTAAAGGMLAFYREASGT